MAEYRASNVFSTLSARMTTQMRVERVAHAVLIPGPGEIDVRNLTQRMHPGIGAARALHAHLLATECLDRGHQRALHRGAVVLDLPADEWPAVVFDGEL